MECTKCWIFPDPVTNDYVVSHKNKHIYLPSEEKLRKRKVEVRIVHNKIFCNHPQCEKQMD